MVKTKGVRYQLPVFRERSKTYGGIRKMLKALLLGLGGLNLFGTIGATGIYHFNSWMRGTHKRAPQSKQAKSE